MLNSSDRKHQGRYLYALQFCARQAVIVRKWLRYFTTSPVSSIDLFRQLFPLPPPGSPILAGEYHVEQVPNFASIFTLGHRNTKVV